MLEGETMERMRLERQMQELQVCRLAAEVYKNHFIKCCKTHSVIEKYVSMAFI